MLIGHGIELQFTFNLSAIVIISSGFHFDYNFCVMQIDVDIGSSSVARSVIGLVLGYVTSLVVDLAILIEVCSFWS